MMVGQHATVVSKFTKQYERLSSHHAEGKVKKSPFQLIN